MKLELISKKKEAKGTYTFFFAPDREFQYLPGQYIYLTLPRLFYPDTRGATRHFTLSSSPTEKLMSITTRIREESGYKKTLAELSFGSILEAEGPNGTFILDENETGSHVFLAGGIGITPFRSFLQYAFDKKTDSNFELLYSNSYPEEIAFYNELKTWEKNHTNFHATFTVTKPLVNKKNWKEAKGRIKADFITKYVKDYTKKIFWVVGPPPMVTGMEQVLIELKIPTSQIRSEKFTGY